MGLSLSGLRKTSAACSWDDFWKRRDIKTIDSWAKRRMKNILSAYVKPGKNVLDAGCGSGFFSSYFISCGCKVFSMDYSERALSITKEITKNRSKIYLKGDIFDRGTFLNIGEKFDIIFTDGLLEHYSKDEQDKVIINMKGLIKEGGYIINFVPNRFSFWSLIRPFYIDIKEKPFIMGDFLDLHRRNGLNIVSCGGLSVVPFRVSPERSLGRFLGMLFYCVAAKNIK